MISPAEVLSAVAARIPRFTGPVAVPALPSLSEAAELARIVGADPGRVGRAADALSANRGAIDDAAVAAAGLVAKAGADIVAIAQRYLGQAAALLPLALVPGAPMQVAAKLAEIASGALTDVQRRLEQLEKDLHPHTSRMLEVAAALEAEPSLAPAPAAQRATEELHTLAGSGPVAMEAAAAEKEAVLPEEEATAENTTDGPEDAAEGSAAGRAAVEAAKSQLGAPYVWGGTGPGGFDCSGLTSWAYKQAGVDLPRMAHEQAIGTQVSYDQLQPGDLAVWDGHVAMYAGDGMYIEAGDPVQMNPVRTSNIGMPFKGFWRPTG